METLEIITNADFFKRKKEKLGFFQEIDYDSLRSRVEIGFSDKLDDLKEIKKELEGIEKKIDDYRKDRIPFPSIDNEVEEFAEIFESINQEFEDNLESNYNSTIKEFTEEFAKAKKQKKETLQKTIKNLRDLTKHYLFFKYLGDFPENKELEDYHEFNLELKEVDKDVTELINRYKNSQTVKDIEDVKELAEEIKDRYNAAKKKRSSLLSTHPAFKYENIQFNDLESELKKINPKEVISLKFEISKKVSEAKNSLDYLNNLQEDDLSVEELSRLASMWDTAANERFRDHRNLLLLNELVYQHDEASETIMKKASNLMRNEAKKLKETYKTAETGSIQFPRKFEEISRYFLIVEDANKILKEVSSRFTALGYKHESWKADNLIEVNKKRAEKIKEFEKEYDKIWDIKKQLEILAKEVKEKGASQERIERIIKLNNRPRGYNIDIKHSKLREDYDSRVNMLIGDIGSAVNSLIESVDKRYDEAEKNPSYNLDNVIELYQQINKMTDISERIEKCYALQEKREKENKERELKEQIVELENQRNELEEKKQLTEKRSQEYASKIDELRKSLGESEAGKKTSEEQKAELEKRLSLKESLIVKYRTAVNNLRATYARLEIEKKTGSEYAKGLKTELEKKEAELKQAEAKKADFQSKIENLTDNLTKTKDELTKEKEAHEDKLARVQEELSKTKEVYNDRLVKAKDELAKAKSTYQKDDIVAGLMVGDKSNGSFNFYSYIRNSPEPETYCLLSLKDILEGRTGERDVFERLNKFSDYLCSIKFPEKQKDREFIRYICDGIKKDITEGSLGKKIGASTYRRGIVNDTLNLLDDNLEV